MVQITTGTFGYWDGKKIRPVTAKDGPVSFSPELEKRLVEKDRIAVYAGGIPEPEPPEQKPDSKPLELKPLQSMKLEELKKLARDLGLDTKSARSKGDFIRLIEEREEEMLSGETPPEFDPEMAVE